VLGSALHSKGPIENYATLWDGMTLEAVYDEMLQAKERGELAP
jgi:hypothetical protein